MEYAFHVCNTMSPLGMARAIKRMLGDGDAPPVLLCIGSDLAIGDSLGPIVGTMVRRTASACGGYVYGTLRAPVTAKEVRYVREFLRQTHPNAKIIAVDAAVGEESEIGLIKLSDTPLRPGSGANKRLGKVGDISILGILAKKSAFPYASLNLTRLNLVYMMAEAIARAIDTVLSGGADKNSQQVV